MLALVPSQKTRIPGKPEAVPRKIDPGSATTNGAFTISQKTVM